MKFLLISAMTTVALLGLSEQAKALNVEACARNPLTDKPQVINLLQPIDQKLLDCVPELSSIADNWRAQASKITSATNQFQIGNNGTSNIETLEYHLTGNYISLVASARAAHTWTIPAVKTDVPVPKFRTTRQCTVPNMVPTYKTVKECAVPRMVNYCVEWGELCAFGRCIKECIVPGVKQDGCLQWLDKKVVSGTRQEGCKKWTEVKVPDGVTIETRIISPAQSISASATCTYNYTLNLSTGESKPVFSCGQGTLGEYKLDASAVTAILNGEMPTMGKLLTSVDFTPPLFQDESRDEYQNVRNSIIARHQGQGSIVYFSSQSFVNWASAKTQGANIILTAISGGGYGAEFARQVKQQLQTELTFMSSFAAQTATEFGIEQFMQMLTGGETIKLNGYDISVKAVNTPEVIQKCIVQPRRECSPEIESPRLGFAVIATPVR